jgi:hypothetical protein
MDSMGVSICTRVTEKESRIMQYEQTNFTQRIKLTAASIEKNSIEIPGRIIRPGGADNPAPSKISSDETDFRLAL